MKVFTSISGLAKELNKDYIEVYIAEEKYIGRSYMCVGDVEIKKYFGEKEIHYILVNENNDKDCKEYMMQYEVNKYNWKVWVDSYEGWQNCKVINIENSKMSINLATVICESGTQLNRRVKFALDEDELKADRCIYFIEK